MLRGVSPTNIPVRKAFSRVAADHNVNLTQKGNVPDRAMWEKNGESTTIELSFIIINEPISDTVFDQNRQ